MISKHSPESCPMNNEKAKKISVEVAGKLEKLTKKHALKMTGSWTVIPERTMFLFFEALTSDAFQKFAIEPDMMKWIAANTTEIKMAMTLEESIKILRQTIIDTALFFFE